MADVRISFKEMCSRFDVTARTLRYYEYIELLHPEREGRTRYYGRREVARMTLIMRGRRFGFSLEHIRQWLEMYDEKGPERQFEVFIEHADVRLKELTAERDELSKKLNELKDLRNQTADILKDKGTG